MFSVTWIPAFARMTGRKFNLYYSDRFFRRDDDGDANSFMLLVQPLSQVILNRI